MGTTFERASQKLSFAKSWAMKFLKQYLVMDTYVLKYIRSRGGGENFHELAKQREFMAVTTENILIRKTK